MEEEKSKLEGEVIRTENIIETLLYVNGFVVILGGWEKFTQKNWMALGFVIVVLLLDIWIYIKLIKRRRKRAKDKRLEIKDV